ncbi:MAG: hypothetical protein AAF654_06890 [Myxococcota bacterium]
MKAILVLLGLFLARESVAAPPVKTRLVVEEQRSSWQPIRPSDVAQVVARAALDEVTRTGSLQLVQNAKSADVEFELRIVGRMVGEAETHTVYLSFDPLGAQEIGSLRAASSVVIGRMPRAKMRAEIDRSTREAARQLVASLGPALERYHRRAEPVDFKRKTPIVVAESPWRWSKIRVPSVGQGTGKGLNSSNRSDRDAAVRELSSQARAGKAKARNALERCSLQHPTADTRVQCVVALRPFARRVPATQRVIVEVYRKDSDRKVREAANEQMLYFTGAAHQEVVQAWLDATSRLGEQQGPIDRLGDVPNLDLVIAGCLKSSNKLPEYKRTRKTCLQLLRPLSGPRRLAILWPYLQELRPKSPRYLKGAGAREGSIGTDWENALNSVAETSCRLSGELEEVAWRRYERDLSSAALDVVASYGEPDLKLVERLIGVVQADGDNAAFFGLMRIGENSRELGMEIIERLERLKLTGAFNPKAEGMLDRTVDRIKRRHEG